MTSSAGTRGGPPTEVSIAELAELVRQLPEQMSQLTHHEVELVKAEMGELVKQQSEHISQEVELVRAELGELVKQQSEHVESGGRARQGRAGAEGRARRDRPRAAQAAAGPHTPGSS